MSWTPNTDFSEDLRIPLDMYETGDDYGLNRRSIRPGNTPLDTIECDDEIDDIPPDAMAELQLEAYRRKLGFPKKTEKNRWPDATTEDDASVDMEISKIIRNSGSDREPKANPLNSKTTSKTAIPLDKYTVGGVRNLFLTDDHFKFENVYFHSEKEEETVKGNAEDAERDKEIGDCEAPTATDTAQRTKHQFKEPTMGVAGEKYVTPTQLYAMKAQNR